MLQHEVTHILAEEMDGAVRHTKVGSPWMVAARVFEVTVVHPAEVEIGIDVE